MSQIEKELKLDDAIFAKTVPDIEKPYQIPANWCWVYAPTVFEIEYGKGLSTKNLTQVGFPVFGANGQIGYYKEYMFEKPQALMSCRGAYSGTMNLSLPESYVTSNSLIISSPKIRMSPQFICYLFSSQDTKSLVSGTAQPQVTIQAFQEFPIPLIPLNEQQRIVDRIESLFTKLDEAKEKAQAVVDGFEDRKAAILHKAFTGDIAKKWREAQTIAPSYETVTIDSVCEALKYGTAKKSVTSGDVVVIRMGNLQQGEIDWTNLAYSNDEEDNIKYKLFPDDVLFNRTNSPELVGKTAIYRGEYPAIYAGYLIKLDYDHSRVIGDYLNYILNSPEAKEYCSKVKSDGVNQSNINAKKIGAFTFRLPQISEQQEIVDTIKLVLEKEKNAKDAALQTVDYIESIKRAILARAFRGELGTNDPNDESAIELLKRILK